MVMVAAFHNLLSRRSQAESFGAALAGHTRYCLLWHHQDFGGGIGDLWDIQHIKRCWGRELSDQFFSDVWPIFPRRTDMCTDDTIGIWGKDPVVDPAPNPVAGTNCGDVWGHVRGTRREEIWEDPGLAGTCHRNEGNGA